MNEEALKKDGDTDYTLVEGHEYVWITVGNISVQIKREEEGVVVDLYKKENEMDEPIGSTWAMYPEEEE